MRILDAESRLSEDTVVAVGVFDGVHLGHQELFKVARQMKDETGLPVLALTFSPHPRTLTGARNGYDRMLTPGPEKALMLEDMGSDYLFVMPFTRELASTPPMDFAEMLAATCNAKHVVCGFNFTFGHMGAGTPADLEKWGPDLGFSVGVVPPFSVGGETVSSTRARAALTSGDVSGAALCLGRPYALTGTVVHGEGRGRRIGIPTSNIPIPSDKLVPGNGVYAAFARAMVRDSDGEAPKSHMAVVNVGVRPTFGGGGVRAEVHMPGFTGDLYGEKLQVLFVEKLRDERKFDDASSLRHQVDRDIASARTALRQAPSFTLPGAYDRMLASDLP